MKVGGRTIDAGTGGGEVVVASGTEGKPVNMSRRTSVMFFLIFVAAGGPVGGSRRDVRGGRKTCGKVSASWDRVG
jgi:hypothetical protein